MEHISVPKASGTSEGADVTGDQEELQLELGSRKG